MQSYQEMSREELLKEKRAWNSSTKKSAKKA